MARVRCENCGTDQEVLSATRASFCAICGDALPVPAELLSPPQSGVRRAPESRARRAPESGARKPPPDESAGGAFGELTDHARTLPGEAPPLLVEEIEEIQAQDKRTATILALIPGYGLWRLARGETPHSGGEKLLLGLTSLFLTVLALILVQRSLPTAKEESSRLRLDAQARIQVLGRYVEEFRSNQGAYPDEEIWQASADTADVRFYDPWGRVFQFERLADGFRIGTLGSDGVPGGDRDAADLFVDFSRSIAAAEEERTSSEADLATAHYVLEPSVCPAVRIGDAAVVDLHGGLAIRSTCDSGAGGAIQVRGAGRLEAGSSLRLAAREPGASELVNPPPLTQVTTLSDPLAGLPAPVFNGVTFTTPERRGGLETRHGSAEEPLTLVIADTQELQPGVYWGGIRVVDGGSVTMRRGDYVVAGGGFSVYGAGRVSGSGVTIFNTLDPVSPSGIGGYDQFTIRDSATFALSAPTAGAYRGILLFQDRNNPRPIEISGSSLDVRGLDGTLYAPNAELRLSGNPGSFRSNLVVRLLATNTSFTVLPPTSAFPVA